MRKARIENGIVREVVDSGDQDFPPFSEGLVWIECGTDVAEFWRYADGAFLEPLPPPAPVVPAPRTKAQIMADIAALTAEVQALP